MGDIASLLGDWFNTIALYTLVTRLTGSPLALGLVFITKMLPFALASPLAGWIADRFDRRRLMIGADLARAIVVLGFLVVDEPSEVGLLYLLIALQVMIGAVFIPARSASIPNITTDRELLTANALAAATWSSLLAIGAALGGFAAEVLGTDGVFLFDSGTYLFSALCILRARIPRREAQASGRGLREVWRQILDGWRLLFRRPEIGRIAVTKGSWSLAGGGLVFFLTLLGEEWMPQAPSVGIGLFFAARGLGTGIGPVAARAWFPDERRWPLVMGCGIAASGIVYFVLGHLPLGFALTALVLLAHTFSGANWVLSTVLLQKRTEDAYRGRVFSSDWLLVTLADTVAILTASLLLESGTLTLIPVLRIFALAQFATGLAYLALVVPREGRTPPPA
ncbi:MAG: MFS transporter [Acidobacteria bacterium]|nr:MFS transporter [Acidobacteriota bacterium]